MRKLLVLALLALGGCELGPGGAPDDPSLPYVVQDAAAPLSSGEEALFEIRYCRNDDGRSWLVSELLVELDAQALHWHSGYNLRYQLTTDLNRDHRFGPGDVLTVSEKDWSVFDGSDVGMTYRVSLFHLPEYGMDEPLGAADWMAR